MIQIDATMRMTMENRQQILPNHMDRRKIAVVNNDEQNDNRHQYGF